MMKTGTIRIELLSDMCVSDGGVYNSMIDTDICYDSYGIPYIPAKRIKGCLRECALEINDWGGKIDSSALFGKEGNQRAELCIQDAKLKDSKNLIDAICERKASPIVHPQNVLNTYSYLRTQTSIDYESGVAKETSLRVMRVAKKGLIFESPVKYPEEREQEIRQCVTALKHMGIARTRGFGEVKVTLEAGEEQKEKPVSLFWKEKDTVLEYEITLKAPIICKSVNGQEERSMDYIEGAKVLGCVAEMLKTDGKEEYFQRLLREKDTCFFNAYISDGTVRYTEAPAVLYTIKNNKTDYRNKLYIKEQMKKEGSQGMPNIDAGLQLNQMKHSYVYVDASGNLSKMDVKLEERYHHRRPDDKSIGRAAASEDANSDFYQISSIEADQTFRGMIQSSPENIQMLEKLFAEHAEISLGYGRNSEYGSCVIKVVNTYPAKREKKQSKDFYVLLKSPTILYDKQAMYSTAAAVLVDEVVAATGIQGEIKEVEPFINVTSIGGYNVTWQLRKPVMDVFDKGSVLVLHCEEEQQVECGNYWLGERTLEGYGEVEIHPVASQGNYCGKIVKEEKQEKADMMMKASPVLQPILDRLFEEFLMYKSVSLAQTIHKKYAVSELRPTVSNMLLMCSESEQIAQVKVACKNRYEKISEKKTNKYKVAKAILEAVEENDLTQAFAKEYQVEGYEYSKDQDFQYLYQCLTQIKYLIRSTNEGGENSHE